MRSRLRDFPKASIGGALLFLVGCQSGQIQMYDTELWVNPKEVAVVNMTSCLVAMTVDDRANSYFIGRRRREPFGLLPGTHTMELLCIPGPGVNDSMPILHARCSLTFRAEASKEYELRERLRPMGADRSIGEEASRAPIAKAETPSVWQVWLEEKLSHERVTRCAF